MLKEFYTKKNINKFLSFEEFKNLPSYSFKENKELLLDKLYFIISGTIAVFASDNHGKTIKISIVDENNYIVGILRNSKYKGMILHYKAQSDLELVAIPENLLERLNNDVNFLTVSRDILFRRFTEISYAFLIRSTYESSENLRYSLELMCDNNKAVFLDDIPTFLKENNISESTFYRSLKKLESEGEIKRIGNFITFSKYKFRNNM